MGEGGGTLTTTTTRQWSGTPSQSRQHRTSCQRRPCLSRSGALQPGLAACLRLRFITVKLRLKFQNQLTLKTEATLSTYMHFS